MRNQEKCNSQIFQPILNTGRVAEVKGHDIGNPQAALKWIWLKGVWVGTHKICYICNWHHTLLNEMFSFHKTIFYYMYIWVILWQYPKASMIYSPQTTIQIILTSPLKCHLLHDGSSDVSFPLISTLMFFRLQRTLLYSSYAYYSLLWFWKQINFKVKWLALAHYLRDKFIFRMT